MLQSARAFLDNFFKSQNTHGPALMQLERTTVTLAAGVDAYVLPADTIAVETPMMVLPLNGTSETQVEGMAYAQYQEMPDKTQQGVPIRVYAEKLDVVTLRFWPVPNAVFTCSYRRQRLVQDAGANATVDMTQRWMRGITYAMAAEMALAASLPLDRCKYLQQMADDLLADAQGSEHEDVGISFVLEPL